MVWRGLKPLAISSSMALVVERAATPDEAVLHLAGEGIDAPGLLGAGRDGHHVLVRHQRHGLGGRVAAGPGVEQRLLPHHFALKGGMDLGVLLFQVGVQLVELGQVGGRVVQAGDGADRNRAGQPLRGGLGVDLQCRRGRHGELARGRAPGVDAHDRRQRHERQQQHQEDAPDHRGAQLNCLPSATSFWISGAGCQKSASSRGFLAKRFIASATLYRPTWLA